jgi:signal peptidase II
VTTPSSNHQPAESTLALLRRYRWDLLVAAVAATVVILDQITKALVLARFSGVHVDDVISVVGNIIVFEYDQNRGAAFSSFTHSPVLLTILILIALGVISWLYWSTRDRANLWLKITFGLIIGGAIGNLIDRFRLGYVVDFIHFQLPAIHYSFYVFNIADSGISIGIVALALLFWLMPRQEAIPEVPPLASEAPSSRAVKTEIKPAHATRTEVAKPKPSVKTPATVKARSATPSSRAHAKSSTKRRKRQ